MQKTYNSSEHKNLKIKMLGILAGLSAGNKMMFYNIILLPFIGLKDFGL